MIKVPFGMYKLTAPLLDIATVRPIDLRFPHGLRASLGKSLPKAH
jgi:hypothetical protein